MSCSALCPPPASDRRALDCLCWAQIRQRLGSASYERRPALLAGIGILAGSGVGGGTRINWCASFRSPQPLRREWAEEHGCAFATTARYTEALDAVCGQLGVHDKPTVGRDVSASTLAAGLAVR